MAIPLLILILISGSGSKVKTGGEGYEAVVGSSGGDNGRRIWRICLQGEETLFVLRQRKRRR
jgi:hypothetical protein